MREQTLARSGAVGVDEEEGSRSGICPAGHRGEDTGDPRRLVLGLPEGKVGDDFRELLSCFHRLIPRLADFRQIEVGNVDETG